MKQFVLPGVASGISMLIIGFGISMILEGILPGIAKEYQNPNLFRPWSDPLMSLYFLHPIILGLILSIVWEKAKTLIKGNLLSRGYQFGGWIWVIATIPGMLMTYASFPFSLTMISTWTLSSLFQLIVAGIILAKMNP